VVDVGIVEEAEGAGGGGEACAPGWVGDEEATRREYAVQTPIGPPPTTTICRLFSGIGSGVASLDTIIYDYRYELEAKGNTVSSSVHRWADEGRKPPKQLVRTTTFALCVITLPFPAYSDKASHLHRPPPRS
jgi:hypothetical protein